VVSGGLFRTRSGLRTILADKLDELDQLQEALHCSPLISSIPISVRRTCAQCQCLFAHFEGGQCLFFRNAHFLCNVCLGGYILTACRPGGCYEREIRDVERPERPIISASGSLPCPFFKGHRRPQLLDRQLGEPHDHHRQRLQRSLEYAISPMRGSGAPETTGDPPLHRQSSLKTAYTRAIEMDCHCGAMDLATIQVSTAGRQP
jgi:hypothetical protein